VSQRGNELVNAIWSARFIDHQRTGRFYAPVFSFYVIFRSTDRDRNARRPHLRRVPASRSSSALGFANRRESLSRTIHFSLSLFLSLSLSLSLFFFRKTVRKLPRKAGNCTLRFENLSRSRVHVRASPQTTSQCSTRFAGVPVLRRSSGSAIGAERRRKIGSIEVGRIA